MRKIILILMLLVSLTPPTVMAQTDYYDLYQVMVEAAESYDQSVRNECIPLARYLSQDPDSPINIRYNANVLLTNHALNTSDRDLLEQIKNNGAIILEQARDQGEIADFIRVLEEHLKNVDSAIEIVTTQQAPFVERISGMWISGENDDDGCPKLVMHLYYDPQSNEFRSTIDPNCKFIEQVPNCYFSDDITVSSFDNKAEVYFGTNKRKDGNTALASTLSRYGEELSRIGSTTIAQKNAAAPLSGENILGQAAFNILGGLIQNWAAKKAISYEWSYRLKANLKEDECLAGIGILGTDYYAMAVASNGKVSTFNFRESELYLYKVSETDSVSFMTTKGDEIYHMGGARAPMEQGYDDKGKFSAKRYNATSYQRLYDKYRNLYKAYGYPVDINDHVSMSDSHNRRNLRYYEELGYRIDMELGQEYYNCCFEEGLRVDFETDKIDSNPIFNGICEHAKDTSILLTADNLLMKMDIAEDYDDWDGYKYYEGLLDKIKPVYGKLWGFKFVNRGDTCYDIPVLLYQGQFKNCKFHGYGILYDGYGNEVYRGNWKNGKRTE